jgi:hypothetical protein
MVVCRHLLVGQSLLREAQEGRVRSCRSAGGLDISDFPVPT